MVSGRTRRLVRASEAQVEQIEQRYQELLDVVPAGIYSTDADGRIVEYNRTAAMMWGKRPASPLISFPILPITLHSAGSQPDVS